MRHKDYLAQNIRFVKDNKIKFNSYLFTSTAKKQITTLAQVKNIQTDMERQFDYI
jgi:hypothetical protein